MLRLILVAGSLPFLVSETNADKKTSSAAAQRYEALVRQADDEGRSRQLAADFIELARQHPRDPLAVDALVWVVMNFRRGTATSQAVAILAKQHAKNKKLAPICHRLVNNPSRDCEKLLRSLLESNPHRSVQAAACFHLAANMKEQIRLSQSLKSEPELRKRYEQFYGAQVTKHLAELEQPAALKKIEGLYERITKSFADVDIQDGTMGQTAHKELFAIRHLSVGCKALEITGEDTHGEIFKLSDYRGKVVLLDFWGNW